MSPRPKEFDPEIALECAMNLFWRKGYEGTSIRDLVEAMDINRFSLYDTYGSKRQLFDAAIKLYRQRIEEEILTPLEQGESGIESIKGYFKMLEDAVASRQSRYGCLMQNSIVELSARDKKTQTIGRESLKRLEEAFYSAVKKAQRSGELSTNRNPHDLASFLVVVAQGLGVYGKVLPDQSQTKKQVKIALAALQ